MALRQMSQGSDNLQLATSYVNGQATSSHGQRGRWIVADYFRIICGLGILLLIAPWIRHATIHRRMAILHGEIVDMQEEQKELVADLKKSTDTLRKLKAEYKVLNDENKRILQELKTKGDEVDPENNDYAEAELLEEAYVARIDDLEAAVQRRSKRALQQKYGDGPYRIEVSFKEDVGGLGNSLIIKTARHDLMPHSIEHFLKMIDLKLWDGLALYHKKDTSSLIYVLPVEAASLDSAAERFADANLTKLTFAEHSKHYPIQKYSVAFSGSPGGPDFFINMDNGLDTHEGEEAESCFGQVVSGREILDFMMENRSKDLMRSFMVEIESVKLL